MYPTFLPCQGCVVYAMAMKDMVNRTNVMSCFFTFIGYASICSFMNTKKGYSSEKSKTFHYKSCYHKLSVVPQMRDNRLVNE